MLNMNLNAAWQVHISILDSLLATDVVVSHLSENNKPTKNKRNLTRCFRLQQQIPSET